MGRARFKPLTRRELSFYRQDIKDVLTDPNLRVPIKFISQNRPTASGSTFTEDTLEIYTFGVWLEVNVEENNMNRDYGGEVGQKVFYIYARDLSKYGRQPQAGDTITYTTGGTEYKFHVRRFSGPVFDLFWRCIVDAQ